MLSEHEGVLNQGLPWEPGCRSDLDSPHGQKVWCGESQWHIPHKPPNRRGAHDAQGLLLRRVGKACRVKRSTHQTSTIETSAGLSQRRWARIAVPLSTLKTCALSVNTTLYSATLP